MPLSRRRAKTSRHVKISQVSLEAESELEVCGGKCVMYSGLSYRRVFSTSYLPRRITSVRLKGRMDGLRTPHMLAKYANGSDGWCCAWDHVMCLDYTGSLEVTGCCLVNIIQMS